MNSIVFGGGDKGKKSEVYYLFGRYFCHGILFTRSHIIQLRWSILFIFCVLVPEGMNSIVFGGDKGKRAEVYYLFGRYFCHGILFTRSHIIQLRWSILFIFCVLASEGMNAIVFGERKRKNQKTTTCSEDLSSRRLFSLTSGKKKGPVISET